MNRSIYQKCECEYCVGVGFPALWKHKTGYIWIEIPKNASGSMKINSSYMPIDDVGSYEELVLVLRNPFDRFVSLYKHYFFTKSPRYDSNIGTGKRFLEQIKADLENHSNKRLTKIIENLNLLTSEEQVHHFYPQVYFIDREKFTNFKVIDISKVPDNYYNRRRRENVTKIKQKIILTEDHKDMLKEIYEEDFEFINEMFN